MTDWTNANVDLSANLLYRPNYGPDDEDSPSFVWRAAWPPADDTLTWLYSLDREESVDGFVLDDPFDGFLDTDGSDTRYYVTNGWPSQLSYVVDGQQLQAMGTVVTSDDVTGGKHDDWLFPGPGNDRVNGNPGADFIAGGSGDDLLLGDEGADTIYGDGFNAPVITDSSEVWSLPTEPDSSVVDGNDQLLGGPRGQGWTDVLTGGGGADAFYLSYTDTDSASGGTGFWSAFGTGYVAGIGGGAVKSGAASLTATAATDLFSSLTGSFLLGGIGTAAGELASEGLSLILGMNKSDTPRPTGEDVMVITDFDPREDVLFMPVPTADQGDESTTLTSTATFYSESATGANGQTGWGIEFTKGTTSSVFAEVFLAQDFLDAFGVTDSSEFAKDFIDDVFDTSLLIDESGVQEAESVYPFPTDPSAYADGVLPVVADTPIDFKAPSGTSIRVFGAFGGLSFLAPTTTDTGVYVSGTNLSDILNVNLRGFDPATATESGALTSETSYVQAFDGDDIVFGGNGIDVISGGDGSDLIYGIGHSSVETVETFAGDDGDDLIYLGWTSMSAIVDGGSANDTASFVYVAGGSVTADLAKTSTDPLNDANATSTTTADSLVSTYALTGIENLGGSTQADTLTGDTSDNVIQGNAGSDTLAGGSGSDTVSYADNVGRVIVDLSAGTGKEYAANGSSVASTDKLTGFESVIGSAFDDTITGTSDKNTIVGGAGSDTLNGGSGEDTLSYASYSGTISVDMENRTTNEYGAPGSSTAATVLSTDSFRNFKTIVGTSFNDQWLLGPGGDHIIDGGPGTDILRWGTVINGVLVDLQPGNVAYNDSGKFLPDYA